MYAKLATSLRALLTIVAVTCVAPTFAGTLPLITDDPETPGAGVWELNFGSRVANFGEGTEVEAPFFEFNHGFTDRDELRFEFSVLTSDPDDEDKSSGISDLLIGYKYRFLEQRDHGWDVAFFPQLTSPTGDEDRDLGLGQTQVLLPLEFSKHFCCNKAWINYEIGYNIASGDRDNNWKFGLSMGREITEKLELLGEVGTFVFQGDEEPDDPFFNLGFKYAMTERFKVLGSAGRSFRNVDETPDFFCYLGVQVLFGGCSHPHCGECGEEACGAECSDHESEEPKKEKEEVYATESPRPSPEQKTSDSVAKTLQDLQNQTN